MIRPIEEIQVHLCRDVVDFRKQIRGLSVLVEEELELDVFSSHLFVTAQLAQSLCNGIR